VEQRHPQLDVISRRSECFAATMVRVVSSFRGVNFCLTPLRIKGSCVLGCAELG